MSSESPGRQSDARDHEAGDAGHSPTKSSISSHINPVPPIFSSNHDPSIDRRLDHVRTRDIDRFEPPSGLCRQRPGSDQLRHGSGRLPEEHGGDPQRCDDCTESAKSTSES